MKIALASAAVITALLTSACSDNSLCSAHCVQMNGIQNESADRLKDDLKKSCEQMGRHGTPEIRQQTNESVTAYCPA